VLKSSTTVSNKFVSIHLDILTQNATKVKGPQALFV